ncbi:MAG: glycosyltransferase, partial [Sodaliphilus sp.]|nr:glycosyltransferase [Sodaliphilus sp.]
MKLSIIVPVYNVEKYVARCLDSLLNQGLSEDDYEIICVNDGSTDHSLQICQQYESEH